VVTDAGTVIEIGETETAPTIAITDYSRKVTDDFGVTSVVKRGFARRLSVRVKTPTSAVDAVQRQLAALRATPAQWIADDSLASLSVRGFYKDFSIDFAAGTISYCSLTIEGLTEEDATADAGADPAPDGGASTLRLLAPLQIAAAMLGASSAAETDYPAWAAGTTYAQNARVILAATHRIYESVAGGNVGHDPASTTGYWLDIGPTNRWAMFDEALGSATAADGPLVVQLNPGTTVDAVALLDVSATSVRVQRGGYDRTIAPASQPGTALFLDLPAGAGAITITVAGSAVAVGTAIIGRLLGLGLTEEAPSAAIIDYSRKDTDAFGAVTVVERAWAKRMEVRSLIRTDALDAVLARLTNVRATPALWIGDETLESLSVYGFYRDASIEVSETSSLLSLTIDGLSAAATIAPLLGEVQVSWPDVVDDDPAHPKPADGATVGAPAGTPVGDRTAQQVVDDLDAAVDTIGEEVMRGATWRAESDQVLYLSDGRPVRIAVEAIGADVDGVKQFVAFLQEVDTSTETSKFLFSAKSDGTIVGIEGLVGGGFDQITMVASKFFFVDNSGNNPVNALAYESGGWKLKSIEADTITYGSLIPKFGGDYSSYDEFGGWEMMPSGIIRQWGKFRGQIDDEVQITVVFPKRFPNAVTSVIATPWISSFSQYRDLWLQNVGEPTLQGATFATQSSTSNAQHIDGFDWQAHGY
jgi:hypothetical protein